MMISLIISRVLFSTGISEAVLKVQIFATPEGVPSGVATFKTASQREDAPLCRRDTAPGWPEITHQSPAR